MRVAVIGGGAVGTLAALLMAREGHVVELFERGDQLWLGASATNEGKIHLGSVSALRSIATHDAMRRGSLEFGRTVEGWVVTPASFKFTTAPRVGRLAAEAVQRWV